MSVGGCESCEAAREGGRERTARDCLLLAERREEEEEVDLRGVDAVEVDVVARDVGGPHGAQVGVGQALDERVEPDLLDERLGDCELEDRARARLELVQALGLLELDLEDVERRRELVREERPRDGSVLGGGTEPEAASARRLTRGEGNKSARRLTRRWYSSQMHLNSWRPLAQIMAWI